MLQKELSSLGFQILHTFAFPLEGRQLCMAIEAEAESQLLIPSGYFNCTFPPI